MRTVSTNTCSSVSFMNTTIHCKPTASLQYFILYRAKTGERTIVFLSPLPYGPRVCLPSAPPPTLKKAVVFSRKRLKFWLQLH